MIDLTVKINKEELIKKLGIKNGVNGKNGEKGKDGENGIDGITPTEKELKELIKDLIPELPDIDYKLIEQFVRKKIIVAGQGSGTSSNSYDVSIITSATYTEQITANVSKRLCDATSNNIIINLPNASSGFFTYKKVDTGANTVTLTPSGSHTIDDEATYVLTNHQQSVDIYNSNGDWKIG